jgi:microcystin-dependent protein
MDGATEYDRASYPAFLAKFGARAWLIAGSTGAEFKMMDIRDMAFVIAGTSHSLGASVGAKQISLTTDHLPQHAHSYDKPSLGTTTPVGVITSILGGVLTTLQIPKRQVTTGEASGNAGASPVTPVPLTPLSLGVNVFVFAGLPQA